MSSGVTKREIRIRDIPAAFCKARCNAWNAKKERCNARRWSEYCDHPERGEAGKYAGR